ncbi:MAG TPA: VOC family protein [Mycobacteriales bacterium]|nr:VOC family protein [Mycobacteriales bacterium]
MSSRFTELAIDCADPHRLARFWCAVLDYEIRDGDEDGVVTIGSPGGEGPVLTFARVPEDKAGKNRLHLDLNPADRNQDAEVHRLLDLGARPADVGQTGEESWVCLTDPEGNEFCVLAGRRA